MSENKYYNKLNKLPTVDVGKLTVEAGIGNLTENTVEQAVNVIETSLKEYERNPTESKIAKVGVYLLTVLKEEGDPTQAIKGSQEFFIKLLEELKWTVSQVEASGGVKQLPFLIANKIYGHVGDKKVLINPITFNNLESKLYISRELRGIKGLLISILAVSAGIKDGNISKDRALEVEMMRYSFIKTKPEGNAFFKKGVLSKNIFFEKAIQYAEGQSSGFSLASDTMYYAYLTQVFSFRNTKILDEKTRLFLDILNENHKGYYQEIGGNELFRKARIYEKGGYTLILRSRFVLIDNMRGQVIINKTPTNMPKKDIELMVRLITN